MGIRGFCMLAVDAAPLADVAEPLPSLALVISQNAVHVAVQPISCVVLQVLALLLMAEVIIE